MFGDQADRPPSSLRGWLSDLYFPALLEGALGPLANRLGPRATLDEPRLGRAAGLAEIEAQLDKSAKWLASVGARYERGQFTTGVDRDVTEGVLTVKRGSDDALLPVAVIAERRPSREVELRVYYAALLVAGPSSPRAPIARHDPTSLLPGLVADHVDALRRGDADAVIATLEANAVVRDASGHAYGAANGTLRAFVESLVPWEAMRCGYADDGRSCAFEYAVVRRGGKDVAPRAGVTVFERGDSGLFRAVRIYDDAP